MFKNASEVQLIKFGGSHTPFWLQYRVANPKNEKYEVIIFSTSWDNNQLLDFYKTSKSDHSSIVLNDDEK